MLHRLLAAAVLTTMLLLPSTALAKAKTYQVTGTVLSVTDDTITVQKGEEKWELDRTPDTKITGDLKVGAKVTIQYTMSAASVDVKSKSDSKNK